MKLVKKNLKITKIESTPIPDLYTLEMESSDTKIVLDFPKKLSEVLRKNWTVNTIIEFSLFDEDVKHYKEFDLYMWGRYYHKTSENSHTKFFISIGGLQLIITSNNHAFEQFLNEKFKKVYIGLKSRS